MAIGLDKAQSEAASSNAPLSLVLAGPGSGKTAMLVERAAVLARAGEASRILCFSFTRGAAGEIERRVKTRIGSDQAPTAVTFHSWCYRVLKASPEAFGFTGDVVIGDDRAAALSAGGLDGAGVEAQFSRIDAMRERRSPSEAAASVEAAYRAVGAVDYVGMVARVVERLEDDREMARRVCGYYSDVLVDEYQDSSALQDALIEVFAREGARIWVVGDDDQSIYGFRSADAERIVGFCSRHADAVAFTIGTNYRCRGPVVAASSRLIAHNRARKLKILRGMADGPAVVARGYADEAAEASAVTAAVSRLVSEGVAARDIGVLARSNGRVRGLAGVRSCGVETLTVHAAKGREWPYVFVTGCEDGHLPTRGSPLEEERRIAYVAMTRASSALAMTFAASVGGEARAASPFLLEAGLEPWRGYDATTATPEEGALDRWPRRGDLSGKRFRDADGAFADNVRCARPARSGVWWSETDDAMLTNMVKRGDCMKIIAEKLRRTEKETVWRIESRGLAPRGLVRVILEKRRALLGSDVA